MVTNCVFCCQYFPLPIVAPCASTGLTNCSQLCTNREDCTDPLMEFGCACSSDCIKTGDCCPDFAVAYNCYGEYENSRFI